jgi:DNA sulfur modification protein DndC
LRILPVERFLKKQSKDAVVVLGLRHGESVQRDRSLQEGAGEHPLWQRQREGSRRQLLLPIIDFGLEEVWIAAQGIEYPRSLDSFALEELYRGASGECPTIKSPTSPPCASGRFGCWTCTVVRRDKSTESLVRTGRRQLQPFLDFRNWLQAFREERHLRWPVRRNGAPGPGPFTLEGRLKIFNRLQLLEAEVDRELISMEEIRHIKSLWEQDMGAEKLLGIRGC